MGKRSCPPLKRSEVVAILIRLGFSRKSSRGSHVYFERVADGQRMRSVVTVDESIDEFSGDILRSMIRQSNFSPSEFYGATRRTAAKASVKLFRLKDSDFEL